MRKEIAALSSEERLEYYIRRLQRKDITSPKRRAKWAGYAARAAFELHPELREDKSLDRGLVAKAGRALGLRAENLSHFVEGYFLTR